MALTHLGRIAKPPGDFTGRELQNIRMGLRLSTESLAEIVGLAPHQIDYIEDPTDGFDAGNRHSPESHAYRKRIVLALHRYITGRGPTIGDVSSRMRPKRGRPRLMVSTLHL